MGEVAYAIVVFLIVVSIVLYSCWLFIYRLKRGENKSKSFVEWLKNIFEALWGI